MSAANDARRDRPASPRMSGRSRRRQMRHTLAVLFLGLTAADPVAAQSWRDDIWTFVGRDYFPPLIAGVREPHVGALGLAWADRMDFMVEDDDPRRVWDIDLGVELPIIGWESSASGNDGRVPDGAFGAGLWIPIDFHMIEDFADDSNPIINTDYRFGGMLKLQYGLAPNRWLGLRLFGGHESTHLGDEFSIRGQDAFPATFERINVSWEYLDVGLLYEDWTASVTWSARAGLTSTLPFGDSYYTTDPESVTESPVGPVTESSNWIDPYLGIDGLWESLFGGGVGWDVYGSAELRWRSVYDYHKADPDAGEDRQASLNLIAGLKKTGAGGVLGRASPFVRLYHGVNPHGQFRDQRHFTLVGVGLRLVR